MILAVVSPESLSCVGAKSMKPICSAATVNFRLGDSWYVPSKGVKCH